MSSRCVSLPWEWQPGVNAEFADWLPYNTLIYTPTTGILGTSELAAASSIDEPVTVTTVRYPGGEGVEGSATSSRQSIGRRKHIQAATGVTWVAQFVRSTTSSRYISGTVSTGTSWIEDLGVNMDDTEANSNGRLMLSLRSGTGTVSRFRSDALVTTSGKLHTIAWQWRGAGTASLFLDGINLALAAGAGAFTTSVEAFMEFPLVLLNRNVRNAFSIGGSGLQVGLYARILDGYVDAKQLSADPWRMLFAPQRIYIPTAAAAATAPTITALSAFNITATSAQPRITYA